MIYVPQISTYQNIVKPLTLSTTWLKGLSRVHKHSVLEKKSSKFE